MYAVISAASRGLRVPFCRVREAEGDTVILSRAEAERNGLDCKFLCRRITLLVHSSLEAVGLLAVVSAELAQHGIGVNCVSAYFHDHLFVPEVQGDRALAVLQALQRRVAGSSTPRGASTSNLLENVVIREMTLGDYDAVRDLLASVPGVTLRSADSRKGTQLYLERNAGLSFVALLGSRIVGCVMCGHDGRRGYLQHLAVEADLRSAASAARWLSAALPRWSAWELKRPTSMCSRTTSRPNSSG